MIDVVEILEHWHAGRSKMAVAASVGVDRETVRRYVTPAVAAGIVPGGPRLSRAEWAGLVAGWFPQLVDAKARCLTFPVINEHRERTEAMLKTNLVSTVHQRLREEHGLAASLRDELLNAWQFDSLLEARVIIEDWRIDYNWNRPHTAHGDLTPAEFAAAWTITNQPQAA